VLKEQIQQFDDRYGDHPAAKGRGISLSYMNYSDSTRFWIGYSAGINNTTPLIVCEPINNKPVILHVHDLSDFVSLPMRNAVELQKESSPKEYEMHINAMSDTIFINGEKSIEQIVVMFDFVNWIVTFDKNGKFVGVETIGEVLPI
jgi:hypothetical protein